jgi:hypothetical protein
MPPNRNLTTRLRLLPAVLLLAVVAGCGGGGGGAGGTAVGPPVTAPTSPVPPVAPTSAGAASAATSGAPSDEVLITLRSVPNDPVGVGISRDFSLANATIRLRTIGPWLSLQVDSTENWYGDFVMPGNENQLRPGSYSGLVRHPSQTAGAGSLSWSGNGRGCNISSSTLVIHSVQYEAGVLKDVDMSFDQYCEGSASPLRGHVHIGAAAMAQISIPKNPQPDQTVIALKSDPGDYIGLGAAAGYNHATAVISVTGVGKLLTVIVQGDQNWRGRFSWPGTGDEITPGVSTGFTRNLSADSNSGGMSWNGEGRGCNALDATVVVHSVRYEAGVLRAIDLDFEQHCEGALPALRGQIRWDANLVTTPPGPVTPAPNTLWKPPADALAPSGNAMYISSSPGDNVGEGWTWWVNTAPSDGSAGEAQETVTVSITETAGLLTVSVTGGVRWQGQFQAPQHLGRLEAGYYGILTSIARHNPARGGMDWTMDGRTCSELAGWFTVDSIAYDDAGALLALDMRFHQVCGLSLAPLRGRIRWSLASSPIT